MLSKIVYKSKWVTLQEAFSLFNLSLLSAVTLVFKYISYATLQSGHIYATYLSVLVMSLMFTGILVHQILQGLCPQLFIKRNRNIQETEENYPMTIETNEVIAPTYSVVGLDQKEDSLKEHLIQSSKAD